jgi:Helix-turn-helix domain
MSCSENLADAVQRVDGIVFSTDLVRLIIHGFRGYTDLATQRYGCAPEWVADVQYVLAEALADNAREHASTTCDNARQRAVSSTTPAEILALDYEFTTAEAAAALGIRADLVRYHCRRKNLKSRKVGDQVMVRSSSVENFKHRRNAK